MCWKCVADDAEVIQCVGDVLEMIRRRYIELEMCWRCVGDVLEMCWRCVGDVLEMIRR